MQHDHNLYGIKIKIKYDTYNQNNGRSLMGKAQGIHLNAVTKM